MISLVCLPSPLHNAWHITLLNKCLNEARMQGDRKRGKRKEVREEGRRKLAFPGHSSCGWHRAVSRKKCDVLSIWLASSAETDVKGGRSGAAFPWGSSLLLEAQLLLRCGNGGRVSLQISKVPSLPLHNVTPSLVCREVICSKWSRLIWCPCSFSSLPSASEGLARCWCVPRATHQRHWVGVRFSMMSVIYQASPALGEPRA